MEFVAVWLLIGIIVVAINLYSIMGDVHIIINDADAQENLIAKWIIICISFIVSIIVWPIFLNKDESPL